MKRFLGSALLVTAILSSRPALAQKGKPVQEFTRQGLLITNFAVGPGGDLKLGKKAADAVRSRMGKLVDKKTMDIIAAYGIREKMLDAGFSADSTYSLEQIYQIGRSLRADEYIDGVVSTVDGKPR